MRRPRSRPKSPNSPASALLTFAFAISLVFGASCASSRQQELIYQPAGYQQSELDAFAAAGGETLSFETRSGAQMAYFLPAKQRTKRLEVPARIWVIAGGNAARALDWMPFLRAHRKPGVAYLMVDYPGYGVNQGTPGPSAIRSDVRSAIRTVAAHLGVDEAEVTPRLAVLGHSLGAAVALRAAADHQIQKVVLVAPFTSMKDMAEHAAGTPLATSLITHRYDNRASLHRLKGTGARITIIHGKKDQIVPYSMGQELAGLCPEEVTLIPIWGAGHNDILRVGGSRIARAM